ncbi:MAG: uS17 family ribosomal protein [candidate division WWE3 bacterium]|nr:uS17 family ribosomal protein [candidate division WWE3 bacterium]
MNKKALTGKIVSFKLLKTVTVEYSVPKKDPKYGKRIKFHKRVLAHLPEAIKVVIGNKVVINPCRPLSHRKHFIVTEVLK